MAKQKEIPFQTEIADIINQMWTVTDTVMGADLFTTLEITEKIQDVYPFITDDLVAVTMKNLGFKIHTISAGGSFECRWMVSNNQSTPIF